MIYNNYTDPKEKTEHIKKEIDWIEPEPLAYHTAFVIQSG